MAQKGNDHEGKKVFFLYPHSVIQKELIQLIARYEFEVYLVNDHIRLAALLREYPESIVFINVDERLNTNQWEYYIRKLRENPGTQQVQFGILTYNEDKEVARHFLMDVMVQAGYIQLKLGLSESARIILKTLNANEAKGRRKFVRVQLPEKSGVNFNIKEGEAYKTGTISDISSGGMACYFDNGETGFVSKDLPDIQLNLRGKVVKVSGKMAGSREEGERKVYIILFERFRNEMDRLNLANFINRTLQIQMDKKIDTIRTG